MELAEYRRMAEVEDTHWWYRSTRALLRQILSDRLEPGGRFLDLGAGTGATGAWLADLGRVVATDFEPMALAMHRELHARSEVVASDATYLPFDDDVFDAVLCVTVLCHRSIVNPAEAVAEMVRVVKPGGVVCLMEPGVRRLRRAHDRVTHTGRRFSRRDLAALLSSNGVHIERSTGAYAFLLPPAAIKMLIERGRSSSDLARNGSGLGGALSAIAGAERHVIHRLDLPVGLSALAIGRRC